jgi:AraC-like DNA-binding protein
VGPLLLPAAAHIIDHHVIRQGPCWGGILGEAPIRLATGDIIAFPRGDPHVMSSEPGMRGTPELDAVGRVPLGATDPPRTGGIGSAAIGGECVLARLSELLFIEVVRRHLSELPEGQAGWLGGLRDASIGRVLAQFHERPARDWTLEDLARDVGVSRSVLAERFSHIVGMPPMQYLAQWRLQLASNLLSETSLGLARSKPAPEA